MNIYEKIFARLEELHMSQIELSRRTGIATSTISDWRKKKINPQADAYGHFPRPSGPRSPARQGHIKRPVLRLAEPSFLRPANQCC